MKGCARLISFGITPEIALAAATSRPAAALGLKAGRIAPGAQADLVWWSNDFHALQVWRAGKPSPALTPRGTEAPRTELEGLETRGTEEIVRLFLTQEATAQRALEDAAPALAKLIDGVAERLTNGGRLFYAGAGTSGRLGLAGRGGMPADLRRGAGPNRAAAGGGAERLHPGRRGGGG